MVTEGIVFGMIAIRIIFWMIYLRVELLVKAVQVVCRMIKVRVRGGRSRLDRFHGHFAMLSTIFVVLFACGIFGNLRKIIAILVVCASCHVGGLFRISIIFCFPIANECRQMLFNDLSNVLDFNIVLDRVVDAIVDATCDV